jgi:riboflavin kinase / FMN adenylyltransferase
MNMEQELARFATDKYTVLTIGSFDGVHLGHKKVLDALRKQARQLGVVSVVVTFPEYKRDNVYPQISTPYLTGTNEKVKLLKAEGIDMVVALNCGNGLAELNARQIALWLKKYLKIIGLVYGPDFTLGKGQESTPDSLVKLGSEMNFRVIEVPPLMVDGKILSSMIIRNYLMYGDVKRVKRFTERYFSVSGKVIHGMQMGRRLGFPTANLIVEIGQLLPPYGTYAALVDMEGVTLHAVAAIGIRPPLADRERTVEVHILDFHQYIYGKELKVSFVERLREIRRFSMMGEWLFTIEDDIERSREILNLLNTQSNRLSE